MIMMALTIHSIYFKKAKSNIIKKKYNNKTLKSKT